jgi:valyl-tRNA synthetase
MELTPIDNWILSKLNSVIKISTEAFASYNFHVGLSAFRQFFWHDFCDNYLEAVKHRLYSDSIASSQKVSGQYTIYNVILDSLKLFAPIAPFIVEEIFHSIYKKDLQLPSIHLSSWPTPRYQVSEQFDQNGALTIKIIGEFRKEKSNQGIPLNTPIKKAIIQISGDRTVFDQIKNDISGTLKIDEIIISHDPPARPYHNKFEFPDEKIIIHWEL